MANSKADREVSSILLKVNPATSAALTLLQNMYHEDRASRGSEVADKLR